MLLPLLKDEKEIGTLSLRREGLYLRFEARTHFPLEGICRAYLVYENGECLLGVLEPEKTGMQCCRSLAAQQVRGMGELRSCVVRQQNEQRWEQSSGKLFSRLPAAAPKENVLQRQEKDGFSLAFPYSPHEPFPLPELFCLASVQEIMGSRYVVYSFAADGTAREEKN